MIISDGRLSTRVTDFFLTRPLINRSKVNLVLTEAELSSIKRLKIGSPSQILPNGIAISEENFRKSVIRNRVAFCSRLHRRKGIEKFIELADTFRDTGISFDIYGPDAGELPKVQSEINRRKLNGILNYRGALTANGVQKVLTEIDLLVLPSKDEPYPMVILEALSVGTPVLIMPSCGFAVLLEKFDSDFVAISEDSAGLIASFRSQKEFNFQKNSLRSIVDFCQDKFGISYVVDQLLPTYEIAAYYAR
jgi:glycosyltransferase involved in cell wall biosynthesis